VTHDELSPFRPGEVKLMFADGSDAALNREAALRRVERDFGLPLGSLAMYCPESKMNRKIAEVKLYVEGGVMPFSLLDRPDAQVRTEDTEKWGPKPTGPLSGGHLEAQLERFVRLWRVG